MRKMNGIALIPEQSWSQIAENLTFAFQPIININTGICLGVEVLLRNWETIGFESINDVFNTAYNENKLYTLDLHLREKALRLFNTIPFSKKIKLFYNLDSRSVTMPNYSRGNTTRLLRTHGIRSGSFVFELSEKFKFSCDPQSIEMLMKTKSEGFQIAIDDFGAGYSGLQLLYHSEPHFVKIDRFFIENIEKDPKKKTLVLKVLNLVHVLGNAVIAEGIETDEEYLVCKELGCDFVQGFLIQKPVTDISRLQYQYESVSQLIKKSRRTGNSDHHIIHEQLEYIEPVIMNKTSMENVFDMFKQNSEITFFPVVSEDGNPMGLIREKDLKKYVYSKYGKDILLNNCIGKTMKDFISHCPSTEIYKSIEKVLDIFTMNEKSEGVIICENGKYLGFLSAQSLLVALNEKNLAIARDQNPLTKLPGNNSINQYISDTYYEKKKDYVYAYFDFDNFKPFNDKYGFRIGDRAILLFANLLREFAEKKDYFIGHIGGDDFFASVAVRKENFNGAMKTIKKLVEKFREDIIPFFNEEDKNRGFIISTGRDGKISDFPLLTVSAAVLQLTKKRKDMSIEEVGILIAKLKKIAKHSDEKISEMKI